MTTYGKWTLVGERYYERGQSLTRALCGGCNTEHVVRVDNLKRGRTLSCAACAKRGPNTGVRYYRGMTFNGVTKPLADWCEQHGITVALYRERVRHGMSPTKAMTTPNEKPHNHGVGRVESIVVDSGPVEGADMLAEIGDAVGVTGQMVGRITGLALKRAQVSTVAMALHDAMPNAGEDYVSDLVALAIDLRLGYALTCGDLSVMELRDTHARWTVHVRKMEAAMFEKKLPFAS